jgi:uncharacterized membrane protein YfcA
MSADILSDFVLLVSAFAGALVSSIAGFVFALVAGVLLLIAYLPEAVVPLLMICSVIVQAVTLAFLRRSLAFSSIGAMLIGGVLGVPLAVFLFHAIDAHSFQIGFGLFLTVYAATMLVRPSAYLRIPAHPRPEAAVVLGGVVGGLTAMPGAMPVLYCDLRGSGRKCSAQPCSPSSSRCRSSPSRSLS